MAAGQPVLNGWLMLPNATSAELMAHARFDSLTVDMQHGMIEFETAVQMFTAISTTSAVPLVRVPWLDPGVIMKTLDAGAYGVICPMINSRDDAQRFVAATRYAPAGNRSWGPVRAALYGGSDYLAHANQTILNFAMIETMEAVDRIDDICSVEGLDAIYVGPSDLSLSMTGKIRVDTLDGQVGQAIRHVMERAQAHGVYPCIHTSSTGFARQMIEIGYSFVTCAADMRFITQGAAAAVAETRGATRAHAAHGAAASGGSR